MRINKRKLVIFCSALLFLWGIAVADVLIFTTGERKEGLIKSDKTPDSIVFISAGGEMRIPRSRIAKIIKEPHDVSYVKIGKGYLARQDYAAARRYFEKALELNPGNEDAHKSIDAIEDHLRQEAAHRIRERSEEINLSIKKIGELMEEKKFEEASGLLDKTERANPSPAQAASLKNLKARLHYLWGLNSLDHLNPRGAATHFEKSLAIQPHNQEVFEKLVAIWEKDPNMTENVIAIYKQQYRVNPHNLEIARRLADLYFRTRNYAEAIPYLTKIHEKSTTPDPLIEHRLRNSLAQLYTTAATGKDFVTAALYYRQLLKTFPNQDPTPLYYYEYAGMLKELKPDDYAGHVKLGNFCKEHHLNEEAKKEFLYVLDHNPRNVGALKGLTEYARNDLAEAELAFRKKDYDATVYLVGQIANDYIKLPGILTSAYELKERAENEIRREKRNKSERALRLAQRGDEYYATANAHINALKSTDRRSDIHLMSDKEEAKKFLNRAIGVWEKALKIDPSLARIDSEDLNTKLRDARAKLYSLTRVIPIPKVEYYPKGRRE